MPTIAKTKRYGELTYRHLKLVQLYSVVSELRLHTNKAVNVSTAKYYHNKLYVWGDFGPFFTASSQAMLQVFYIELDGFIGAFWNTNTGQPQLRKNEQGSLAAYLYDGTRNARKKSAKTVFESLIRDKAKELAMINDVRGKVAHFKKLNARNSAFVPGDKEIREILNELAKVLYNLGFQRWNKPHFIEQESDASASTQALIDKVVGPDGNTTRQKYLSSRSKWFGK